MKNKNESGPSCFGLFTKSWLLSALLLSGMAAATVGLGIHYFSWSSASWSDYSAWNSYPVLALFCIGATSTLMAFGMATFLGLASALLGRGSRKSSTSTKPAKARPQSVRKTTV